MGNTGRLRGTELIHLVTGGTYAGLEVKRKVWWWAGPVFLGVYLMLVAASARAEPIVVEAESIELDPDKPLRTRFGDMTLLSSFVLRSSEARFGGLSGLVVDATGRTLYAVSDRGYGVSARLHHEATDRLSRMDAWEITTLRGLNGEVVSRRQRDAEALVQERDGSWLVAFEQLHRVWRYPPSARVLSGVPESLKMPPAIRKAPGNAGLEAMTRLADGRLLVMTEEYENEDGSYKGWLVSPEGFDEIAYEATNGFRPTDLATLPSGDVLLLERRYRPLLGVAVRLRCLRAETIQPEARLRGREVLHLAPPLVVDNFEGVAVRPGTQPGPLIYLVSDDNYNFIQSTLLLQFRLNPVQVSEQ